MKKLILTENQISKVVGKVIEEQNQEIGIKKAIQCFLNSVLKINIKVDGLHGSATKNAIMKFQNTKKGIISDGVWGYNTAKALNDKERSIYKACIKKHGDFFDRIGANFS